MTTNNLQRYVNLVNRLVAAGYKRELALLAVYRAYGLSPDAVTQLAAETRAA